MTAFLSRLFRSLPLLWFFFAVSTFPSITWGYDAQTSRVTYGYDLRPVSATYYDSATLLVGNERKAEAPGDNGLFVQIGRSVAAKAGSQFIYRTGSQTENALTKLDGVSFRESISSSADRAQVFDLGEKIWAVNVSKLPPGSVVFDGGTAGLPVGHVSVNATAIEIKAAIMPHGPSNPLGVFVQIGNQ